MTKFRIKTKYYSIWVVSFLVCALSATPYFEATVVNFSNRPEGVELLAKTCTKKVLDCEANTSSSKTILLIGDSHAGHLLNLVFKYGKHYDYNVYTYTNNPCSVQIISAESSCKLVNKKVKNWIILNKPEVIIVSQYITEKWNLDTTKDSLNFMQNNSKRVLLIGNNPIFPPTSVFGYWPNISLLQILINLSRGNDPVMFQQSIPITKMDTSGELNNDSLLYWAKTKGILVLDPWSLFCDAMYCHRKIGNNWLYFDYNHLSKYGADLYYSSLEQIFAT